VKGDIEKAITETREAVASDDAERISNATSALMQASMKIGEAVYANQGAGAAEAASEASGEDGDNVVDADFEEVKDDDKKKSA